MHRFLFPVLAAFLLCADSIAQDLPARVVAKVGGETIDRHEFLMRYESAVWIGENRRAQIGPAKHAFLLSMIAEKLLANEAVERGIDKDPHIRNIMDEIERMLLMDALYRREMKHNLEFTDEQIDRAARLIQQDVTFRYVRLNDPSAAARARELLETGLGSDALADSLLVEPKTATMSWGEVYPGLEEILFERLSVGEASAPVEIDGAWYVVQLINRKIPVAQTPGAFEEARQRGLEVLRHRTEKERFHQFIRDFGKGKTADVNPELFGFLADAVAMHFDARISRLGEENLRYPLRFLTSDFEAIRVQLADLHDGDFIVSPHFRRSFLYVLDRLDLKGFSLMRPGQHVDAALRDAIWELIAEEFLIEEARTRRLHTMPGFWRDMEMWRAAYFARGLRKAVVDSLRAAVDSELWEVNIRKIEVAALDEAESLKRRVRSGESMAELARQYSLDAETAPNGGETGYRILTDFGDLAELIRTMEIGDLAGPVFSAPNFVILELIDRRRPGDIEEQLETLAEAALNDLVARLAREQGVHIDLDALEAINVSQLNVLLVRFLGFGNRLLAVPTIMRLLDWIDALERDAVYVAL